MFDVSSVLHAQCYWYQGDNAIQHCLAKDGFVNPRYQLISADLRYLLVHWRFCKSWHWSLRLVFTLCRVLPIAGLCSRFLFLNSEKLLLFPPQSDARLLVDGATVTSVTCFVASPLQLRRVFSCLLSDLFPNTLLLNKVFDVLRRLQLRLFLVSGNHDRLFSYPHARIQSCFCLPFCVFYERNIRGFAKRCCISAVPNTESLLMLSFGEQGRYSATSEVITAVLLRLGIWDVWTGVLKLLHCLFLQCQAVLEGPEYEDSKIIRNVGKCRPNGTVSHPRRPESSRSPHFTRRSRSQRFVVKCCDANWEVKTKRK
jgi:hypothetical protein